MAGFLTRLRGYVAQPIGRAAQAGGRAFDYLSPGKGTSAVTQAGRRIVDPNTVYTGGLISPSLTNPKSYATVNRTAPGGSSTFDAQYMQPLGLAGATEADTGGGGGGGAGGASAQNMADLANLRGEIIARRDRANSIFDALTGAVNSLTQERRGTLENQFQQQQGQAVKDFGEQSSNLSRAYQGRGLGQSSFKQNALDLAAQKEQQALQDLGTQRQSGLAQIGSEAANQLAGISADRGSLGFDVNQIGLKDDGTFDLNELRDFRNKLDDRIRSAETQQVGLGTQAGFRGRLEQIAPYNGVADALRSALTGLVQSATPKPVQDKLASAIIGNYAPTDAQTWQKYYEDLTKKQPAAA